MKSKTVILFALITVVFAGCSEDETPLADHLGATWQLSMYERNNVDETGMIYISAYTESYAFSGNVYERSYTDGDDTPVTETGKFTINEDEKTIHISDVSSINDFSEAHSTLSSSVLDVETIQEDKLVYTFENGGDMHRFTFIRVQ